MCRPCSCAWRRESTARSFSSRRRVLGCGCGVVDWRVMKPRGMLIAVLAFVAVAAVAGVVAVVGRGGGDRVLLEATLDCASHYLVLSEPGDEFRVVQGVAAINSTIVHQQGRPDADLSPDSRFAFRRSRAWCARIKSSRSLWGMTSLNQLVSIGRRRPRRCIGSQSVPVPVTPRVGSVMRLFGY